VIPKLGLESSAARAVMVVPPVASGFWLNKPSGISVPALASMCPAGRYGLERKPNHHCFRLNSFRLPSFRPSVISLRFR
jgi:hypothetical protein